MIHLFFYFSFSVSFFFLEFRRFQFLLSSVLVPFSSYAADADAATIDLCFAHVCVCVRVNSLKIDEYTRISTPRSEVLFKKGYLMRDKKYVGPTNTISAAGATTSSSNDSGSVSVISNEETASYYSIQSMSPDDSNSTYMNGGGGHSSSTDSNSATYPNDGFEHDLSLIYSSGFYDNSGYFYVNRT